MVAFPKRKHLGGGKATMQKKARDEMVKAFEAELKELVRGLLEAVMQEERAMYLETHPISANSYHTRDLLTLVGPVDNLKVPRVREGDFHPGILPTELRGGNQWVLSQLGEAWGARRFRRFGEIRMGSYHADWTH